MRKSGLSNIFEHVRKVISCQTSENLYVMDTFVRLLKNRNFIVVKIVVFKVQDLDCF